MKWYATYGVIPISTAKEILPLGMILSPVNTYRENLCELTSGLPQFYQM